MASILVIHDKDTPGGTASDQNVKAILDAAGHTATLIPEDDPGHPYTSYDAVVVTESGSGSSVDPYDAVAVPLVSMEYDWSRVRMGALGENVGVETIDLVDAHPLNAGFPDPLTLCSFESSSYAPPLTSLPAGVTAIALNTANTAYPFCAIAEQGATLTSGTAPARRVCFASTSDTPGAFTADGADYFVAMVEWAAGGGVTPTVPSGTAAATVQVATTASGTGGTPPHPVKAGPVVRAFGFDADLVVPAPEGVQAGDVQIVLLGVAADDEPITDVPPGWTQVATLAHWHGNPDTTGATHWAGLYVTTTDTGPATFHRDFYTGARTMFAFRVAYRHAGAWGQATLTNTQDDTDLSQYTVHAIPGVTAPADGVVVAGLFTEDESLPTFTPPAGFTERLDTRLNAVEAEDPLALTLADLTSTSGGTVTGDFLSDFACYGSVFSLALSPVALPASGSAATTVTATGTAQGSAPRSGTAAATVTISSQATGKSPARGRATTTVTTATVASGSLPARGAASAVVAHATAASGSTPHRGTATGLVPVNATATGHAPVVGANSGRATATITVTGQATGSTVHRGGASTTVTVSGLADGQVPGPERDLDVTVTPPVATWVTTGPVGDPLTVAMPGLGWPTTSPGSSWATAGPGIEEWPTTEPALSAPAFAAPESRTTTTEPEL